MSEEFPWGISDIIITEEMEREYDEFFTRNILPRIHSVKNVKNEKKNSECVWFVTINPPRTPKLSLLLAKISKAVSKAWVDKYYYAVEQRGETEETAGTGVHCHILLQCKAHKRKSQVIRELYSTFQCMLDNKASIDVRFVKADYIPDKIDYICGKKFDKTKLKKCLIDNYFRKKNKLESYYTNVKEDAATQETGPGPCPDGGCE